MSVHCSLMQLSTGTIIAPTVRLVKDFFSAFGTLHRSVGGYMLKSMLAGMNYAQKTWVLKVFSFVPHHHRIIISIKVLLHFNSDWLKVFPEAGNSEG